MTLLQSAACALTRVVVFFTQVLLHENVYTQKTSIHRNLLHTHTHTHTYFTQTIWTLFYTQEFSRTEAVTHTHTLLHKGVFTDRSCDTHTHMLWHIDIYRCCYTQVLIHRCLYKQRLMHTQRCFHTVKPLQRTVLLWACVFTHWSCFYTKVSLHTDVCRNFYTQFSAHRCVYK